MRAGAWRGASPAGTEAGVGLVEVLIAVSILAIGLVAVAGIARGVARQTRESSLRTGQALAARQVLALMVREGYEAARLGSSDTTVEVGERSFTVARAVTQVGVGLRELSATVSGDGVLPERSFVTRLHRIRPLP